MTTARQFIEQGEARGEERGRQSALSEMLIKQLTLRFKTVPDDARATILAADRATLERWMELVVTAPSIEAILAG